MGTLGKTLSKRSLFGSEKFVGLRYGNRVVLGIGPVVKGYQMWSTRCDCGFVSDVSAVAMDRGEQLQCKDCQRRDQTAHRSRTWKGGMNIPMTEFNRWRRSAEKRQLSWQMTFEILDRLIEVQDWKCALSGAPLDFNHGYCNAGEGNASLDRIDSTRGYEPGNVQFVTKAVNFAKQANSDASFIELCRAVVAHADRQHSARVVALRTAGTLPVRGDQTGLLNAPAKAEAIAA